MTHFPSSDIATSGFTVFFFLSRTYFSWETHPLLSSCILLWCFVHALAFVWHKWADPCWRILFYLQVSSEITNAKRPLVYNKYIWVEVKLISEIISKGQVQMPVGKVWVFLLQQLRSGFLNSCIEFHSREKSFAAKWLLPWSLLRGGSWRGEWVRIYCLFQSDVVSFNAQCFYYSK